MPTRTIVPLAASLLLACAHVAERPAPSDNPASYFPLAVGNEWTYLDRSPQLPAGEVKRRTVRILSRDSEGYYRDSERGSLRATPECVEDRARRILCAPFEIGHRWSSVVSVTSTEHYEIAAVGETVRVAAGTFEGCVRVRARTRAGPNAENVLEISYAPGVGPVRIGTYALVDGKAAPQVQAELASFHLEEK